MCLFVLRRRHLYMKSNICRLLYFSGDEVITLCHGNTWQCWCKLISFELVSRERYEWKFDHANAHILLVTWVFIINSHQTHTIRYIYSSCYYHHQIGSIHLSHCFHIFSVVVCLRYVLHHFCHSLYIHSGKTGNLFSLVLCSLWWVHIVGYVLACRSYSLVCTLHHLIIIIVQTLSEDIEFIKCL